MRFLKRLIGALLVLFVLAMTGIGAAGYWYMQDESQGDVALILGSKVNVDGSLSPQLQARLDRALRLHKNKRATTFVVSGGVGIEGQDEAVIMAAYLVENGIDRGSIVVDSNGITTFASAQYISRLYPPRTRLIVVSQFFHLPRGILILKKTGFEHVSGAGVGFSFLRDIYSLAREVPAFVVYACCKVP